MIHCLVERSSSVQDVGSTNTSVYAKRRQIMSSHNDDQMDALIVEASMLRSQLDIAMTALRLIGGTVSDTALCNIQKVEPIEVDWGR